MACWTAGHLAQCNHVQFSTVFCGSGFTATKKQVQAELRKVVDKISQFSEETYWEPDPYPDKMNFIMGIRGEIRGSSCLFVPLRAKM